MGLKKPTCMGLFHLRIRKEMAGEEGEGKE
jgi:hypothetical protein